jgi:hypothetical protein
MRRTTIGALMLLAASLAGPWVPAARGHGLGTWDEIYGLIIGWQPSCDPAVDPDCVPEPPPPSIGGCVGCHFPGGGTQSGSFAPSRNEDAWYGGLVNAKPANGTAASAGKLRVHKYQPWNSLLVDKLRGHLKGGEGGAMPCQWTGSACSPESVPYAFTCPGGVEKIVAWILDGARQIDHGPNDPSPGEVVCEVEQPEFVAPDEPGSGYQVAGASGTVAYPARELLLERTADLGNAGDEFVNRIEIAASAGTEYVSVTRAGDAAPLAVARGESLDLALPAGVAVRLAPQTRLEIRQLVRNDYWKTPTEAGEFYANETTGTAIVNLHTVASVVDEARPVADDVGTQTLLVPPQRLGTTGGAYVPAAAPKGGRFGIWTDRRVLGAALVDSSGELLASSENIPGANDEALTSGYVAVSGLPAWYRCVHSNGFNDNPNGDVSNTVKSRETTSGTVGRLLSAPLRYACAQTSVAGRYPTPGLPVLLGAPGTDCARGNYPETNDCAGVDAGVCVAANLVGGPGLDQGRCTLVGLAW